MDAMQYLGFLTDSCPNIEQQSARQYSIPIQEESAGNKYEQQNQYTINDVVLAEGIKRVIETIEPLIAQKAQEPTQNSTKKTNRTMNSFVRNEWA